MADAALAAALDLAEATVCGDDAPCRLALIAMGKCGARELNYVSDVDVIFVASPPTWYLPRSRRDDAIASEAFFQVDAALRPRAGTASWSEPFDSHLAYYQRAKTGISALLISPAAVGRRRTGEAVHRPALMPMVWKPAIQGLRERGAGVRRRVAQLVPPMSEVVRSNSAAVVCAMWNRGALLSFVHGRSDESYMWQSTVARWTRWVAAATSGGRRCEPDSLL